MLKHSSLTILTVFLLVSSMNFPPESYFLENTPKSHTLDYESSSQLGSIKSSDYEDVFGLDGTHFLFKNETEIKLIDVESQRVLDNIMCNSSPRISADRNFVMCGGKSYRYNGTNLVFHHNYTNEESTPETNLHVEWINSLNSATIYIKNGTTTVHTITITTSKEIQKVIHKETSEDILIIIKDYGTGYEYFNYSSSSTHEISSASNNQGYYLTGFSNIQYGAFSAPFSRINCHIDCIGNAYFSVAPGAYKIDQEGENYNKALTTPQCSMTAYISSSPTSHFVTVDDDDIPIPKPANHIACNSEKNTTILSNDGTWFSVWGDIDSDGDNDLDDQFPIDNTQWDDLDMDGYGDNPIGNYADDCPTNPGNSTQLSLGCPDADGDKYADKDDFFPNDNTQWFDNDFDGYGDNSSGLRGDSCPAIYGTSTRNDTLGCPDFDYDGWADMDDDFDNDASQWIDSDSDGFGDNLIGFQGDACPDDYGKSWMDVYGCTDSDHDGWSDEGDAFPYESTQWSDRDFDGYGDNQSQGANLVDAFPGDTTQWNDSDGDGFGDNPFGNSADRFPDDPLRWQDSDHDGVADQDDPFPDDASQSVDTDGDGYGDDINGSLADVFPNDPNEWKDSDADGYGDNSDAFPFDPTQIEDRDGDGMGDNPMGIGADKFPDDNTQWGDIDGDGYGDNPSGNNPDAFVTDATQWSDTDGDGYGDNPSGRLADAFPNNPTQWVDEDGDGLGDNQSGIDGDPYLNDFDNDGYNDSIDLLPKLASPSDLDADGCPDEVDVFPDNPRECDDSDNDGVGDNEDADDDNDGWTDTDEIRLGTNSLSSAEKPVDSFEIVLPGTAIGLGAWDLIGIFGGVPIFTWLLFGFATRNGRTARIEERMHQARSREELEEVALHSEYLLMLRLIGPHQGIRLERIRAELDDELTTSGPMDEFTMPEPDFSLQTSKPFASEPAEKVENGYEWLTKDGVTYYRLANSQSEWTPYHH